MKVQRHRIEVDKWCEGVRVNHDPGKLFILEWIKVSGSLFRKQWDESLCKDCCNWKLCGYKVIQECDIYDK